jgi:hypothetical protein
MSRKSTMTDDQLGKIAWDTYAAAVGGKAFNGDPLPTWAEMCKDDKKQNLVVAWKKSARAVASAFERSLPKEAPSFSDPRKIPQVAIVGASSPPTVIAAHLASTSMPAPVRTLTDRTKCCGSLSLSLKVGRYVCPCGDHVEAL